MNIEPYIAYAKKTFLQKSAYRFDHLMNILSTCLKIFIFWEIYRTMYLGKEAVGGITMPMVTTNFVISIGLDAVFYTDDFFLPGKIWDGSIATELLRPVSFKGRMIAENLGNALFKLLFCFTPTLLICVFTVGIVPPHSIKMFGTFLFSIVFGYGVLWSLSFAVQMLAFWLVNIWSINTIKNVFVNVLSGSMIPLWFMPEWMQEVLQFTPFSSIYFVPVQIYLGQLSNQEILLRCSIQLIWIGIIYAVGNILWKKGQKKLVVQGG